MMTTHRARTGAGELETFAMANCLMLLNNQSSAPTSSRGTHLFPCKTCGRKFSSFQALGGHRASHKKVRSLSESSDQSSSSDDNNKQRAHVCTICGAEFPIGQALGGHMRRHRQASSGGGSIVTVEKSESSGCDMRDHKRKIIEDGVVTVVVSNNGNKRVCLDSLDLNLYLWKHDGDDEEKDGCGVVDGEVVVDEVDDFLKLELRQPIN